MSYTDELKNIRKHFLTGWDSIVTPVMFSGDTGLTKGTERINDEAKLDEWVRVTTGTAGAQQSDLAGAMSRVRYQGVVTVNVFVKARTGAELRARELMDIVDDKFSRKQVEDMTFQTPQPGLQGQIQGFYQMTLQIPFYRDQF